MFMRNIMNISQRRTTRQPTRTNSHTIQRRQFRFNNGYNSNTQYTRQSNTLNNSNTNSTSENEQNVRHYLLLLIITFSIQILIFVQTI